MSSERRQGESVEKRWTHALVALIGFALLVGLFGTAPGCSDAPPKPARPLLVVGVDGLEWDLVLRWVKSGELPNLGKLLREGSAGRLATLEPTYSPAIWTTIATGKLPEKHDILGFSFPDKKGEAHLFTSLHRQSKAIWNLLDDAGRACHVLGWWCTFPVEPIRGVMVAQTSTRAQIDISNGRTIWKGSYLDGLPGQVEPEELTPVLSRHVQELVDQSDRLFEQRFGKPAHGYTKLTRDFSDALHAAFCADQLYFELAKEAFAANPQPTALLVYFGIPDIAGHKFWRWHEPAAFAQRPSDAEIEDFGNVIRDAYRFVDDALGELLALKPGDVVVVSDHGFHASNRRQPFPDEPGPDSGPCTSGDHQDAPPGVFIAWGPSFRAGDGKLPTPATLTDVGRVQDVLPTLLATLRMPYGKDMDGRPLQGVLRPEVLAQMPDPVASHEDEAWRKDRKEKLLHAPEHERHFEEALHALNQDELKRLGELGYIGPGLNPPPAHGDGK